MRDETKWYRLASKSISQVDWHYGWLILPIAFVAMGLTGGISAYSFGLFVSPLEQEFQWTRTQINGSLSFAALMAIFNPFVGRLMDRFGARPVMVISLLVLGISLGLRPLITELWHWYGLSALQYAAFPGAAFLPTGRLMALWFPNTRGRMVGVASMGANFGGMTMPILASAAMVWAGWQMAYMAFAIICICACLAAAAIIHERPRNINHRPDAGIPSMDNRLATHQSRRHRVLLPTTGVSPRMALHSPSFYLILFAILAATFGHSGVIPQIIPHLEASGLARNQATFFLSALAFFGMAGKVVSGYLSELTEARYVMMSNLAIESICLVSFIFAANTFWVWLFLPFFGIAFGGTGAMFSLLPQEAFGLRNFGTIGGLVMGGTAISGFAAPLLMGISFDETGSYRFALIVVLGIFLLGALGLSWAKPMQFQE